MSPIDTCPKSMVYGPCGGVHDSGACEVDDRPCPFVEVQRWTEERVIARAGRAIELPDPAIVVDVRAPARWSGDTTTLWSRTARSLTGCLALLGEHVDNPRREDDAGPIDPAEAVRILTESGVPTIATVTGRDRDLAAAEEVMGRFAQAGAIAIHCVTGDHPAAMSIDRPARFGAEAVTLVELATRSGHRATVGESPASLGPRAARTARKQAAGAGACILNHAGRADQLVAFAESCRSVGVDIPMIAPIPMVADKQAALGLAQFPGLRLPPGFVDRILGAEDPAAEGLQQARAFAGSLARSGRFAGVNLSGSAAGSSPEERLASTEDFIAAVREGWTGATS